MTAEQRIFSVTVDPTMQDVGAIIAHAAPSSLLSTTFFSPTSLLLNFGPLLPGASPAALNASHKPLGPHRG